jgi:hypothetical protein
MLTAALDGSDVRVVDDCGHTSHFCWRDEAHLLAFTAPAGGPPGFYLLDGLTGARDLVVDDPVDGHCQYLPDNDWIVSDTYPLGPRREQELYLYHVPSGGRFSLGKFGSPPAYGGEWRCDLHPRISPSGDYIVIDSVHGGNGRQMYLLKVGAVNHVNSRDARLGPANEAGAALPGS